MLDRGDLILFGRGMRINELAELKTATRTGPPPSLCNNNPRGERPKAEGGRATRPLYSLLANLWRSKRLEQPRP